MSELVRTLKKAVTLRRLAGVAAGLCVLAAAPARGQDVAVLESRLHELALAHAGSSGAASGAHGTPVITRVEVRIGELDRRVRLSPCARIEPYLPPGLKPWGRTRIGVRCKDGERRWNVFLPATVSVYAQAWVARTALSAGEVLTAEMVQPAEVDLAAAPSPAVLDLSQAIGRRIAAPLAAGEALRSSHLRPKQWFAAGETVKVVARGRGFAISSEGRALAAGLEGQPVKVRTHNGRVLTGIALDQHTVEVRL